MANRPIVRSAPDAPSDALQAAYRDNRLLAAFPADVCEALYPASEIVQLEVGEQLFKRGDTIAYKAFPLGTTMISGVIDLADGRSVEVASVGREGAAGGMLARGQAPSFARAEVIVAGPAVRVPRHLVEDAKVQSEPVRNLFSRYADYLVGQIMQSIACNSFHSIEQRAARWLLTAQDRAGDRLALTQEALAGLLGVQRTTLNAVARQFADEGLISTRRGTIAVHDRAALEARACECHDRVESFFGDIIGSDAPPSD